MIFEITSYVFCAFSAQYILFWSILTKSLHNPICYEWISTSVINILRFNTSLFFWHEDSKKQPGVGIWIQKISLKNYQTKPRSRLIAGFFIVVSYVIFCVILNWNYHITSQTFYIFIINSLCMCNQKEWKNEKLSNKMNK